MITKLKLKNLSHEGKRKKESKKEREVKKRKKKKKPFDKIYFCAHLDYYDQ